MIRDKQLRQAHQGAFDQPSEQLMAIWQRLNPEPRPRVKRPQPSIRKFSFES